MEAVITVLISLLAVVVSGLLARISHAPLPLMQMALGAAIPFTGLATELEPQVFFLLFLPPLLFLDGWRIPKDALQRDAGIVLKLAFGLVLFTVVGMGWFIHWLIPAMPVAVAFAVAAVISPTDPIAVSALAARTPLPRRLMHILQGEALLNDASGLVCLRFAVAAVMTGTFSLAQALGSFVWMAAGGLVIGVAVTAGVARAAAWSSAHFEADGGGQILVTLLLPFGVYLLAERLHCSGILAAVAAGLTMSFTDVWPWRAAIRLRRTAVWDTLQTTANGSIFVLLGAQLPALVQAAPVTARYTAHASLWWLVLAVLQIVAVLAVLRFVWVWLSLRLSSLAARRAGEPPSPAHWRVVLVATLAGVRGAVTLAGVMTLPLLLPGGARFPERDLAILLAAGVIVVSMLLATLALPLLLKDLKLPAEPTHRAAADRARLAGATAAVLAIEAAHPGLAVGQSAPHRYAEAAARINQLYRERIERWSDGTPAASRAADDDIERRLRLVGLQAERAELLRFGRDEGIDELVLRRLVRELDHQEARHAVL